MSGFQTVFSEQEFWFLLSSLTWAGFPKGRQLWGEEKGELSLWTRTSLGFLLALEFSDVQLILLVTYGPVGMDKLSEPREKKSNQAYPFPQESKNKLNEEKDGKERREEEKMLPFHVPCFHVHEAIADFPAAHTHLGAKFDFTDF